MSDKPFEFKLKCDYFRQNLISWYRENKRLLPWREENDPFRIWISEIILQQTRVSQGLPYYLRFIKAFPNIQSLAMATEQEVLRLWQGLGYYSRARNMHQCAKEIHFSHGGVFPHSAAELKKLKGIGEYTAAAISSIAFGEKVAVVDGNVYRVLSRIFGIAENVGSGKGKKMFSELANRLIPENDPGEYNQALMEFGALYCVPSGPDCSNCVFQPVCLAKKEDLVALLPVNEKRLKKRNRYLNYLFIQTESKVFLKKRGGGDIWQGLYDMPVIETGRFTKKNELRAELRKMKITGELIHIHDIKRQLTHQTIHASFYRLQPDSAITKKTLTRILGANLYSVEQIMGFPKPILIDNFFKEYIFL